LQDRESAYEKLQARAAAAAAPAPAPVTAGSPEPAPAPRPKAAPKPRASNRQSMGEAFTKSLLRQAGSTIARELMRGVLGSLKKR
jgi:hypothetical protein